MRRLVALMLFGGCAGAAGGCTFVQCDPEALLVAQAGPGASACGTIGDPGADPVQPYDARACVLDARGAGRSFWFSIDQDIADGRKLTGFADDGARTIEVDYEAGYSMGIGGDSEDVHVFACGALGDRGPRCSTMGGDLCFLCGDPQPIAVSCPR